jgi:uncharacterized protein (TIGR02611 family)
MCRSDEERSTAPGRIARKLVVAVVGTTVLALGVALLVLPGPAVLVIPIGLAILATEFLWARRILDTVKQKGRFNPSSRRGSGSPD